MSDRKPTQPHYDAIFGRICRWLSARDLEMHTPDKGESYICRRPLKRPRDPYVRKHPTYGGELYR